MTGNGERLRAQLNPGVELPVPFATAVSTPDIAGGLSPDQVTELKRIGTLCGAVLRTKPFVDKNDPLLSARQAKLDAILSAATSRSQFRDMVGVHFGRSVVTDAYIIEAENRREARVVDMNVGGISFVRPS